MKHLVVGYGQIGKAIHKVLGKTAWVDVAKKHWDGEKVDVAHICIPYTTGELFFNTVNTYRHYAKLVITHSTTPIGTCDALGVVHSPIRGTHPYLEKGIRTFVKYFGGKQAYNASKIFSNLGIKTKTFKMARTTEAIKLLDTFQYGRLIMLEKEIHELCKENKVDFETVYVRANKDYNEGYTQLGKPEVVRPFLKHVDGPIGGHCVVQNAELLGVKI